MIKSASSSSSPSTTTTTRAVVEPTGRMISRTHTCRSNSRDFQSLKSEAARLQTFSDSWPVSFISAEEAAKAGFFFLQEGDKVQCAFCRGVAGEWEEGDNPLTEHKKHFPRCPFVCNLPVDNIPLAGAEEAQIDQIRAQEEAVGIDVCGPFVPETPVESSASIRGAQPLFGNMNDVATSLAIQVCGNGPVNPNLATLPSRIKTFGEGWPTESCGQTPAALAEAGFFWIERLDHVKCFYCDGGLKNWEKGDDPWVEHARWFPACSFVVLTKEDGWVSQVAASKPPSAVSQEQLTSKSSASSASAISVPRQVSDQELRNLIDTPIVQAALEIGMELWKVKNALQRKIQQTGQPFLTTESLLEAVLGRRGCSSEYESDHESEYEKEEDDESFVSQSVQQEHSALKSLNLSMFGGRGSTSTSEASPSSSSSSSSGDEDSPTTTTTTPKMIKLPASRSSSGDSGISSQSSIENEQEIETSSQQIVNKTEEKLPEKVVPNKELELEEELRKLREQTQCKICMDNRVDVVFLPCGHLVSCTRCATALSTCAVCRQPIKAYVKTYLS